MESARAAASQLLTGRDLTDWLRRPSYLIVSVKQFHWVTVNVNDSSFCHVGMRGGGVVHSTLVMSWLIIVPF